MKKRKYKKEKSVEFDVPEIKLSTSEEKIDMNYKKWKPILDALNVTDEKLSQLMVAYAESRINKNYVPSFKRTDISHADKPINPGDLGQNLLPMSMKVLSQLNITHKFVMLKDGLDPLTFSVNIDKNKMAELKNPEKLELIQQLENELVQKLVDYINKELETKDNLYISSIAQSLSLISDDNFTPIMYLKSAILIN